MLLQCRAAELDIEDGQLKFRDGRATDLTIGGIARAVAPGGALFEGDAALEASYVYEARQPLTSGFSVHIAKIRLDPRTGFFRVLDYLVTHDAGRALNRMIVDGQVVGAVADGIGGAMFSEMTYDADGQPLTGSLADYLVSTAPEIPRDSRAARRFPFEHQSLGRSRGGRGRNYSGRGCAHQCGGARHRPCANRARAPAVFAASEA